jgi:hypothetical protein
LNSSVLRKGTIPFFPPCSSSINKPRIGQGVGYTAETLLKIKTVLTWYEGDINVPQGLHAFGFEIPNGFQVHDPNTFHVLSSTSINVPIRILFSTERIMRPFSLIRNLMSVQTYQNNRKLQFF